MPHWVGNTRDYNAWVRQTRALCLDAPRVQRSTTKDLAITGYVYNDIGDAARNQSDIGFAIAEVGGPTGVHRATCVVAGGTSVWAAGISLTVTFTAGAGGTIQLDDNSDWIATHGFTVGDLIRIEDAVDAVNDQLVARIASITNNNATNDLLTVETEDVLAAESADVITAYPIGSGAIFEVERDTTGNGTVDTHVAWLASNVEAMSKAFDSWYALNRGNADWVVGDYWEWTNELGPFTLYEDLIQTVFQATFDNTADTLTLSAKDQALGITWASLGFLDEQFLDLVATTGTTVLQRLHITTLADFVLTFGSTPTLVDETEDVQVVPRSRIFSDPVLVTGAPNTITRDDGGSWITDGFVVNGFAEIQDTVSNNGYFKVNTVTATILSLDDGPPGPAMTAEVLPAVIAVTARNTSLQAWTEHRWRLATASGTTVIADDAITAGVANGRLVRPTSDGNYTSEWIGIGPGLDPVSNPQTVYIGMQTQFLSTTKQNVEHRIFDVVSDAAFNLMLSGEPNVVAYQYMAVATPMESFLVADGEMATGFSDVNTAVSEWFYSGFTNIRGTTGQLPRPMFLGAMGVDPDATRITASSTKLSAFFDGGSQSGSGALELDPPTSCAWFRWIDGQFFAVFNKQRSSSDSFDTKISRSSAVGTVKIATWPWLLGIQFNANAEFFGTTSDWLTRPGRTPTTIDPTDRTFPLLPITGWMEDPDANIIFDLKNIFYIPGIAISTKDRQPRGHRIFYMGSNHAFEGVDGFAALELN